jgi:hypothetical protein
MLLDLLGLYYRQAHDKRRALPWLALYGERAAVSLRHNVVAEREALPQAGTGPTSGRFRKEYSSLQWFPAMPDPQHPSSSRSIARIVHKARDFEAAAQWDREQHLSLSPQERLRAARLLKDRAFPPDSPDVRSCREIA